MNAAPAARRHVRTGLSCLIALAAVVALYWIVFAIDRDFHQRYLRGEDRLVEWLSFWGYAGASAMMFLTLRWRRSMPPMIALFVAGVAFFFFMCAGEEISWGQRLIGFHTPAAMETANEQHEFNLHNLHLKHVHPVAIVEMLILLFTLVGPLAARFVQAPWGPAAARSLGPIWAIPCIMFAEMLKPIEHALRPSIKAAYGADVAVITRLDTMELTEMCWGLTLFFAAVGIYFAWRQAAKAATSDVA